MSERVLPRSRMRLKGLRFLGIFSAGALIQVMRFPPGFDFAEASMDGEGSRPTTSFVLKDCA